LSKTVFSCPIFDVAKEELTLESGKTVDRYVVKHPGAVVVIPRLHQETFLLIEQYRLPVREKILEFPAGTLEPGEDPLACARRELIEETGYRAESWTPLGLLYPTPGFCDEIQHLFVAEDLTPEYRESDEDEEIEVQEVSSQELKRLVREFLIRDCKTLAAYARYCSTL